MTPTPISWREQVIEMTRARREELVASNAPILAEIKEADAVLATFGIAPDEPVVVAAETAVAPPEPTPEPEPTPGPEPTPEPPEAEPPIDEGEKLKGKIERTLKALDTPLSAKRIRTEVGVDSLGSALFEMERDGRIHRSLRRERGTGQPQFEHGPAPKDDDTDGAGGPRRPTSERQPAKRSTSDDRQAQVSYDRADVEAVASELGCFTVKRAAERLAEKKGGHVSRPSFGGMLKDLAAMDRVERHGGDRGPGVYYVHRDHGGAHNIDIARGDEPLRGSKAAPKPPKKKAEPKVPPKVPPSPEVEHEGRLSEMSALRATDGVAVKAQQREAAEKQLRILEKIEERGKVGKTSTTQEIAYALPNYTQANVARHMHELADASLIIRTGVRRWSEGQTGGKGGDEFRPMVMARRDEKEEAAPGTPEPGPATTDAGPGDAEGADGLDLTDPPMEAVRDFCVKRPGKFGMAAVHAATEGSVATVEYHLRELERRGTIKNVSPLPDMALYEHVKANGPGKAAEMDMKRRREGASVGGGGGPVAGTGQRWLPNNRDVRDLVQDLRKVGYDAEPAGSGHLAVTGPGIRRILISGTPRSSASVKKDRSRLRKMGVPV